MSAYATDENHRLPNVQRALSSARQRLGVSLASFVLPGCTLTLHHYGGGIVFRTHDGNEKHVFHFVHTPYLVVIPVSP